MLGRCFESEIEMKKNPFVCRAVDVVRNDSCGVGGGRCHRGCG